MYLKIKFRIVKFMKLTEEDSNIFTVISDKLDNDSLVGPELKFSIRNLVDKLLTIKRDGARENVMEET